jgi:hypothetical protein
LAVRLPWQGKLDKARTMTRPGSRPCRFTSALLLVLLFAGCSGLPVQEVSDARQAMR